MATCRDDGRPTDNDSGPGLKGLQRGTGIGLERYLRVYTEGCVWNRSVSVRHTPRELL